MKNIFQKLITYIEDEDIKGLLRYCLILLPFVGGAIFGIGALISYITRHKEALIIIGVAACMLIPALMEKKQAPSVIKTSVTNGNVAFFDRILLRGLYTIFSSYASQFGVIPPGKFSDLQDDLSSGFDSGRGMNVYRFKIISDGEALEPSLFHETLTIHLEEQLASGVLALGKPTAEFGGQLYPKLFIDECLCAGGVWHMSILICDNEKVAQYIANKRQTLFMRHSPVTLQYEDGDF